MAKVTKDGYAKVAGRCQVHNDLAWLWPDGGITCMYDLIVEGATAPCTWGPMPRDWRSRNVPDRKAAPPFLGRSKSKARR